MTHVQEKNVACYFMGCPCHLVHNIASHASDALHKSTCFDVEDLCVDIYYWFDKSTKCKGILRDFCGFCDSKYREVVRYVSVRWLSLKRAVYRILQLYGSLQSYFNFESESQPRFRRLVAAFETPMTEIYSLFYESVLLHSLTLTPRGSQYLSCSRCNFIRKLRSKFITLQAMREQSDITNVDFCSPVNHLADHAMTTGTETCRNYWIKVI